MKGEVGTGLQALEPLIVFDFLFHFARKRLNHAQSSSGNSVPQYNLIFLAQQIDSYDAIPLGGDIWRSILG